MKIQLLIPAAGLGTRLGTNQPKALVDLAGKPLLVRTLQRFEGEEGKREKEKEEELGRGAHSSHSSHSSRSSHRALGTSLLENAIIVIPPGMRSVFEEILSAAFPGVSCRLVPGGAERQESVANGLEVLEPDTEIVVIHDAARPFVAPEAVWNSIEAAAHYGAATVAIPSIDTILQGDAGAFLVDTPDRRFLWACQTPQTFRVDVIRKAHADAKEQGYTGTDDASLVRRMGGTVKLVMGSPLNFKVTTPVDFALAQCVVREGLN